MKTLLQCTFLVATYCFATATPDAKLNCSKGYDRRENTCYRFDSTVRATYDEALANCRSTFDDLVSIHSNDENEFVKKYDATGVLIGLRYNKDDDSFSWSDGTPYNFSNPLETNFKQWADYFGDCAQNVDGLWKNAQCEDDLYKFVCQSPARNPGALTECRSMDAEPLLAPLVVESPGYSGSYDLIGVPSYCFYKIAVPTGQYLKLTFDDVSLDENEGFLFIYKNENDRFSYLQVDNDFNGLNVIIDHNSAIIKLVSTPSGKWRINATGVERSEFDFPHAPSDSCPDKNRVYILPETSSHGSMSLFSPGYPNRYNVTVKNVQCRYLFAARTGHHINMLLDEITASVNDYGWLYSFSSFADAFEFTDWIGKYDTTSKGLKVNFASNHVGIVMSNRTSGGTFKIDFMGFEKKPSPEKYSPMLFV